MHVALPSVAGLKIIRDLELRLHRFGSALSISRFAHDGEASVRVNRREQRIAFRVVDQQGGRAAVGFQFDADALLAPFALPTVAELSELELSPQLTRWLRYLALTHYVEAHPTLQVRLNTFLRDWLQQIVLLTAVSMAEREAIPLQEAFQRLRANPRADTFVEGLQLVFLIGRMDAVVREAKADQQRFHS